MKMYEVAVAAPLRKTLTYAQPADMDPALAVCPGQRVLVPLGRRMVTGYILAELALDASASTGHRIKPIAELLDRDPLFAPDAIPFFRWIADYYHHPLGEVIRTALPGGLTAGSGRRILLTPAGRKELADPDCQTGPGEPDWLAALLTDGVLASGTVARLWREPAVQRKLARWEKEGWVTIEAEVRRRQIKEKKEILVSLAPVVAEKIEKMGPTGEDDTAENIAELFKDLKKSEQKTLSLIHACQAETGGFPVLRSVITRGYSGAGKALRELETKNMILQEEQRVYRDPFARQPLYFHKPEQLTGEQVKVLDEIMPVLKVPSFQPFLLHGVTGCGKTEVYLRAAEEVLAGGRGVLVLVPEIALASQLEAHFYCRFGDEVALLHSGLSVSQRQDQWQRIAAGLARIVVGARSAVFAPLANPGLVIVDEEHEPAYKQDDGLRYNGRDLAILRARFADCPVILGSATPSVVSYHHACSGKYRLLTMRQRVHDRSLPEVQIVNLSEDRSSRPDLLFSDHLIRALWENMERRQQSLLFVNRRGFASFMMCRDCGHIVQCRHCQVSLTLHRHVQRLVCHYCGYSLPTKIVCPSCNSVKVEGMGLGSERIEEEVRQLIPHARVARLDSDTVTSRSKFIDTLRAVHQQDIDILVGTQMIAKGLHFPNMTLVGVVWADSGLGMPDFRASERTFQLLAQVTGRAGRGENPGRVIVQTYQPHHYALQCARDHDYENFFARELELRRDLQYPPFSRMVNIRISSASDATTQESADRAGAFLRKTLEELGWRAVEVLGPAPAPLVRIKNRTRWQVLLKSGRTGLLHELCERLLEAYPKICSPKSTLSIDVDPENMM